MKSAWRRPWDFVRQRFWAFTFMVMLVPQLITAWHIGDYIWLAAVFAILISMAIAAILEIQWFKASAIRRTAAKVITPAAVVVGLVSIFLAFWRQSQQPKTVAQLPSLSESVQQPNGAMQQVVQRVAPTALQITPDQATQGQAVEVTIATTTFRFTQGSIPHFRPGITVLDSHSASEQKLVARIKLDEAAPPGARRIWVTTKNPQIAIDDSPRGAFSVITSIRVEK